MLRYESRKELWPVRVGTILGMAGAAAILSNLSTTTSLNWRYILVPPAVMILFLAIAFLWQRGSCFLALLLTAPVLLLITGLVLAATGIQPSSYNSGRPGDALTSWALIGVVIIFGTLYFFASRKWWSLSWPLVIIYLCVVLIIIAICAYITAGVFEDSHPSRVWNSPVFQDLAGIGTLLAACAACVSAWVATRSSRGTPTKDSTYHELVGELVTKIYDGEVTESERKQLEKLIRSLKKNEKMEAELAKLVADNQQSKESTNDDSAH
jgi:hypothetical protein